MRLTPSYVPPPLRSSAGDLSGENLLQVELVPHNPIEHEDFVLLWGEHLERESVGVVVRNCRSTVPLVQGLLGGIDYIH